MQTNTVALRLSGLLGDEHPDVAKTIAELGEIMAQQGKSNEAHVVLSAAISIQRKVLGEGVR